MGAGELGEGRGDEGESSKANIEGWRDGDDNNSNFIDRKKRGRSAFSNFSKQIRSSLNSIFGKTNKFQVLPLSNAQDLQSQNLENKVSCLK